ncbi:hypothetical protein Q8A73_013166 [Channa argus]|nr:hypothetical protein Q8A73_013166 [Channa argus]
MTRTSILLVLALCASVKCLLGDFVTAKLGESVKLSASRSCTGDEKFTLIKRLKDDSPLTVALRVDGVWEPGLNYTSRISHHSVFGVVLSRLNINDNGLYEFTCGGEIVTLIQLEIFRATPVSVSEGGTVELPCYYYTAGELVKSVRWERNGSLVIEMDRASREIRYGTGFEGKGSVSANWYLEGNLSLTLKRAQLEDTGDYLCYIQQDEDAKRRRGHPAAATLTVSKRHPDPDHPKDEEKKGMESWSIVAITVFLTLVIVGPSAFVLGWWLKSCR